LNLSDFFKKNLRLKNQSELIIPVKGILYIAVIATPSHSYGVSLAMGPYSVMPPDTNEHTPP